MMLRPLTLTALAACTLFAASCSYNYLEKPRPMKMHCPGDADDFTVKAAAMFKRNGYKVVEEKPQEGYLLVQDTIDIELERGYSALIRTWRIDRMPDTVEINVWSLNVRKDGSDVKQTWDQRYGNDVVKDWMRPIMVSLESACGLGDPLKPR
jgi:hypothetical protein